MQTGGLPPNLIHMGRASPVLVKRDCDEKYEEWFGLKSRRLLPSLDLFPIVHMPSQTFNKLGLHKVRAALSIR